MFYILNKNGEPLMPSARYRHIKNLIKEGKAVKVSSRPFVVRLLYETPNITQPIVLGIDPGRTNIGLSAVTESGTPVFEAELVTRNKQIPKLMKERAASRRKHRNYGRRKRRIRRAIKAGTTTQKKGSSQKKVNASKTVEVIDRTLPGCKEPIHCIGIKNKEARFNNRKIPKGWLTPTANHLLQTHLNVVKKLQKFLPISEVVVELNKFAFMAMDNPHIQKWQYQKGPLYGTSGLHETVSNQQEHHCIFCDKPIEHFHHIVPQHKGGSDTLPNIVGLCDTHHALVHTEQEWTDKLANIKAGLNKKYGALSVLNQIIPYLVDGLAQLLPTFVTTGYSTSAFRKANGIEKTHNSDAYCIACSVLKDPSITIDHSERFLLMQFRRHDRQACMQEMVDRKYILNGNVVAVNRHKAIEQKVDSLEEYVAKGGRADQLKVKPHSTTYKLMNRVLPGAIMLVDGKYKVMTASKGRHYGKPDYYEFSDGTKATPKHCHVMAQNTGIVFV